MLTAAMRRRLLSLSFSLLLLITQQLGALHLLQHLLQPATPAAAVLAAAGQPGAHPAHGHGGDGDAACQVCLVLAALASVALPAAWAWRGQRPPLAAPLAAPRTALVRRAPAPYHARGPPGLPVAC